MQSNYQILVYNQDYIDLHFKTLDKVHGIFTLNEGDEEDNTADKIAALEEARKGIIKRQTEISGANAIRLPRQGRLQRPASREHVCGVPS